MYNVVAFTGHRKLPSGYYNHDNPSDDWLKVERLIAKILTEFTLHYHINEFIVGGAIGFDTLVAKCVMEHRTKYEGIKLVLAVPFPSYASKMLHFNKKIFLKYEKEADKIVVVSEDPYTARKLFVRNEWMVMNSDILCSFCFKKSKGGTYQCMEFASKNRKPILNIDADTLSLAWC